MFGGIMMKYILTAAWAIICVIVLFVGQSYWNERTDVKAVTEKTKPSSETKIDYFHLTKNWPSEARQQFLQAQRNQKPFHILFVGSMALGTNEQGWAKNASAKIIEAFGSDNIEVSILTYDETTTEFVEGNKQQELKADLILFEPFLLNDNDGQIGIQDSLANLSKVIQDVKQVNPKTTFILQPSYPLYGATFYPQQVKTLKNYAEEHKIAYLDHWTAWPNSSDLGLKDYLLEGQSGPNEKGIEVWEKAVEDYFVSRE
jgi:predicted MPP superfamily phosphohydrolase